MKKYLYLAIMLLIVSFFSCQCFRPCNTKESKIVNKINTNGNNKKSTKITKKDSLLLEVKKNINVNLGDTFDIKLLAQFSSGKIWKQIDTIPEVILINMKSKPADDNKFHNYDWQIFEYVSAKKGKYKINYIYKQPWNKPSKSDSLSSILITIK